MAAENPQKVAIIGSGLIGRSYAMVFASGGYKVTLYDLEAEQINRAKSDIKEQLEVLEQQKLLRGSLTKEQQLDLITGATDLKACLEGAFFVQECVPERLEIKRALWSQADPLVSDDAILSSSTSALLPSSIAEGMLHKDQFVVCHPTNPPFYAPLVEVVPSQWTRPEIVTKVMELLSSLWLEPVLVNKEIQGFVLNRLQYALLGEAWRLVRDGVISPLDLDKVMTSGLGTRYAFIGVWETAYLNAEGMESYVSRYADMIFDIQKGQGPAEKMGPGPTLDAISKDMEALTGPITDLQKRRQWRDKRLAALAKLKADMAASEANQEPTE